MNAIGRDTSKEPILMVFGLVAVILSETWVEMEENRGSEEEKD